jgi:DNA-binding PucR family transcriptional regulator
MNTAVSGPQAQLSKWPLPSPRVCELLRKGAEIALNMPPQWLDEIDEAGLFSDSVHFVVDDPVIMAGARRVIRSSLRHWAQANANQPGAPVAAHIPPDMQANARELVRRGTTDQMFNASRVVQNSAWQLWMGVAFELTSDPKELRELLDVSARSISAFNDANMEAIAAFMKAEREQRLRGSHVERRELVTLILEGAAVSSQQASQRLGYALEQSHHGAIVWSEEAGSDISELESAAQALARCTGAQQTLTVIVNAATLWVWTSGGKSIDPQALRMAVKGLAGVRMTIGSAGQGIEGFRHAHLDALATQRLLGRLRSSARVVSFDMVRLVALMTQNSQALQQFVSHTLGELAFATPILRRTLLTFLNTGCNATLAAELLHTHRNTLLRRLARAEELLPRPLENHRTHVASALEALAWTTDEDRQ